MTLFSGTFGPRNEERFCSVPPAEREYLIFQIDFCLSILRQRPEQVETLQAAANALTALGYFEDGLAFDRRLVALCPTDPEIVYNLACSLSLMGQIPEAMDTLKTAIHCGYSDLDHLRDDIDLTVLREQPEFQRLLLYLQEILQA